MRELVDALAEIVRRAVCEGDIAEGSEPADIARLLVSMYIGVRHTSDLEDAQQFLSHLEKAWALLLPGLTVPDRMSYFTEFIRRRTFVASGKVSAQPD